MICIKNKSFPVHYSPCEEILKRILANLYCIKYIEIKKIIDMYEGMFHIKDYTKYFCHLVGYTLKGLKIHFLWCSLVLTFSTKTENCNRYAYLCMCLSVRLCML